MKNKKAQNINSPLRLRSIKNISIQNIIPFVGLILIIAVFTILTSGRLVSIYNLKLILDQSIILIIACVGVTFVMSMGSLDFSQGSVLAICAVVGVIVSKQSIILGIIAALVTGAAIGAMNGFLVAVIKIPSFIVTISGLFVFRGLTSYIVREGPFAIPKEMLVLDNMVFKLPILGIVLLAGFYLFNYMIFGKQCRAIGSGEISAVFSGVNVRNVKILAFALAGLLAGLCGVLSLIRTGVASTHTGTLFEIDILIALVLGGLPVTGGAKSKIRSGIIGGLMLAFLGNGLVLVGVSAHMLQLIKGIIFLGAVYISIDREGVVVIK